MFTAVPSFAAIRFSAEMEIDCLPSTQISEGIVRIFYLITIILILSIIASQKRFYLESFSVSWKETNWKDFITNTGKKYTGDMFDLTSFSILSFSKIFFPENLSAKDSQKELLRDFITNPFFSSFFAINSLGGNPLAASARFSRRGFG